MTLMQRIQRAGQGVEPGWDERDVERVWQGLKRKRRRRAVAAAAGVAAVATAGVAVWAMFVVPGRDAVVAPVGQSAPRPQSQPSHGDDRAVRGWLDGRALGGHEASLAVVEDTPRRVVVALAKGGARFDVVPRPDRVFSVRAGAVTVSVLGTAFSVERVADRVGVAVTRGAVQVDWGAGARRMAAGEDGWFPPLVVSPAAVEEAGGGPGEGGAVRSVTSESRPKVRPATAAPASTALATTPGRATTVEPTAPRSRPRPTRRSCSPMPTAPGWRDGSRRGLVASAPGCASILATSGRRSRPSRSGGFCSASCTVRRRQPWRSRARAPWHRTARWRRTRSRARSRRGRGREISIGPGRVEPNICVRTRTERGQPT